MARTHEMGYIVNALTWTHLGINTKVYVLRFQM